MAGTEPIPARIHVLIARAAPYALIIRRGPSKHVCTIGWNLRDDTFQLGQWLKGRIYEYRCDLSPDGRHLIYFAMNGKWESDTKGSWTAISKTPYLKALGLWAKGDCWNGGGLFADDRSYTINGARDHEMLRTPPGLVHNDNAYAFHGMSECPGIYFTRLHRDGWQGDEPSRFRNIDNFDKPVSADWFLRKRFHADTNHPPGKGVYYESHALVHAHSMHEIACPKWGWADVHKNHLLWAADGKIFRGQINSEGQLDEQELTDLNDMTFEPIAAPY